MLEAVRNDPPGLIVIDLMLGGSDGILIADRLSNDQEAAGIPVMALSTSADLEAVQRAFAAGVEDYLGSPLRSGGDGGKARALGADGRVTEISRDALASGLRIRNQPR